MYYEDINPEILEQSGPFDAYIIGFGLGMLVILLFNKYILPIKSCVCSVNVLIWSQIPVRPLQSIPHPHLRSIAEYI